MDRHNQHRTAKSLVTNRTVLLPAYSAWHARASQGLQRNSQSLGILDKEGSPCITDGFNKGAYLECAEEYFCFFTAFVAKQ